MAVALDSDAVVGFLDRSDKLHDAANETIRELLKTEQLAVSVITYAEVLTGARLGHHDEEQVRGFFSDLISRILPVDVPVADRAARLRAQTRTLKMPDALIAATAELDQEVDLLVSGDRDIAKLQGVSYAVRLLSSE